LKIRLRPEVEAEIADAADWYEARSTGLGTEFLRAVDAAIASIQRYPLGYQVVFKDSRRALLRRFPYSVIYSISDNEILIVTCIHGKRDPKSWQDRV
jgi:plasmid stabilization system protein ParE